MNVNFFSSSKFLLWAVNVRTPTLEAKPSYATESMLKVG